MSYNCDTWKIKKLESLRIPIAGLYKHPRVDWHPERIHNADGTACFRICEGSEITGTIDGDFVNVTEFQCRGEGSGTAMNWILEPALEDSTGELIASCVWEGGDSINQIIVKDGAIEWQEIEI